jgi:pimeloyl-ACP methyl ester carboxylesterase
MRTDHSIEINGATLHYEERGAGTPLVLIHGGLASSAMWEPHLPDLTDDRRGARDPRACDSTRGVCAPGACA